MEKVFRLIAGLVFLLAAAVLLTGPAAAEMYVEGYLGGVKGANAPMQNGIGDATSFAPAPFTTVTDVWKAGPTSGRLGPAVIGGLKVGTWFVKEGFLGYNYPEWMKYFGFNLDFMVHRLNFRSQTGNLLQNQKVVVGAVAANQTTTTTTVSLTPFNFWSEGFATTLAFMFVARYGFLPDSEVPFGRLQPYVAVGPGIFIGNQAPAFRLDALGMSIKPGNDLDASVCLATEAGVRWMCLKNVSIDLSFKYRYARPNFNYHYLSPVSATPSRMTLDPVFHLFSSQLGAAYHF